MDASELESAIAALGERPADIRKKRGKAIDRVIALLDSGTLRVCEPLDGRWVTHAWIKHAILLYFQRLDSVTINAGKNRADGPSYYDKITDKAQLQDARRALRPGRHRALWLVFSAAGRF